MAWIPHCEVGTLVGETWRQRANASGQDYYENISTRAIQNAIPTGWEDVATDIWSLDGSKSWQQWRNTRTGRIKFFNPNPPAPRNYLDRPFVQAFLRTVERSPNSRECSYRNVMTAVLDHFFLEAKGFAVCRESGRIIAKQGESLTDVSILKILAFPRRASHYYDYCLIESKGASGSWPAAKHQLKSHCGGTENPSKQVYGIIHVGLHVQFFTANKGVLTATSSILHIRNDVDLVTDKIDNMKDCPLPFI